MNRSPSPETSPNTHGSSGNSSTSRGVLVSVVASALFAVIFLLAGTLHGWSAEEVFGWRIVLTLVTLTAILPFVVWGRTEIALLIKRIRAKPLLLLPGAFAAALVGVQLWLFMWAPLHGMAMSVAFGYFLLPLTMVLAGRFFFHDVLSKWRKLAVAAAAVGVIHQAFAGGGLAWPTLLVCLGYPVYFVLRRKIGFDNLAAFGAELLLMLPVGLFFILTGPHGPTSGASLAGFIAVVAIGILGGLAMVLYLLASKLLPLSLFGLLGYVEPVLLLGVSLLLGATLGWSDALTYGPIILALLFLAAEGRPTRLPAD